MNTRNAVGGIGGLAGLLLVILVLLLSPDEAPFDPSSTPTTGPGVQQTENPVEQLFRDRISDVMVTLTGPVDRILPDDNDGSRHQRFIVRTPSGRTVLIAHNIDLAQRVPLEIGDTVTVRGEYEWSDRGGTMHWTHHDPKRWREGGWIEHRGVHYE
jgi:hypothetical protein